MGSGSFRSILCPVDFSEHSIEALRFAIGLAGRDQARLTILTVNEPLLVEAASADYGATYLEREAERELLRLVEEMHEACRLREDILRNRIRVSGDFRSGQ